MPTGGRSRSRRLADARGRSDRTTNERADRPRADSCWDLAKQESERACPAQMLLVPQSPASSRTVLSLSDASYPQLTRPGRLRRLPAGSARHASGMKARPASRARLHAAPDLLQGLLGASESGSPGLPHACGGRRRPRPARSALALTSLWTLPGGNGVTAKTHGSVVERFRLRRRRAQLDLPAGDRTIARAAASLIAEPTDCCARRVRQTRERPGEDGRQRGGLRS